MTVVREGRWYEPDELAEAAETIGALTTRVILDAERLHRCVLCRAEQPHDVRWSHYAMELRKNSTGESEDVEYTCCPSCEPKLDAMLFDGDGNGR